MPVVPGPPSPPITPGGGPPSGPCAPWTTDELVKACCGGLDPVYDTTTAIAFATEILYRLSGRQFPGLCERTVWPPCARCCGGDEAWWMMGASDWGAGLVPSTPSIPYPVNGGWANCWNCSGGGCDADCGMSCIPLPGPIVEIGEVVIGGVALPDTAYIVDTYRRLCRVDGENWPTNNNYSDVSTPGVDGWFITYTQGRAVPPGGVLAASILACQIAKNQCGATDCVLPQRLKEITREGVDMAFADPLEFIGKGEVGIYEVDLWLHSVNPRRLQRRARVYRADESRPHRFTG